MTLREQLRRAIAAELVYWAARIHAGFVAEFSRGLVDSQRVKGTLDG